MDHPPALTEAALAELLAQAQDQSLIGAVSLLWNSTHDIGATAKAAVSVHHPSLEMLVAALRAVTAGTPAVTAVALGNAMHQANPGWDGNACQFAAANAFKSLPGLYPRRFFGDMAAIPTVPNDGILSSPDIVITGTSQLTDPQALLTGWNADPSVRPAGNRVNFAYVRGLNLFPGVQEGRVYLYCAPGNVTNNPAQWLPLKTTEGMPYASVQASNTGNLWHTGQAFAWTPPSNAHQCLIARIETANYPNPLPKGTLDPSQWVSNSPAIAWRNLDSLAGLREARSYLLEYGNTDSRPGRFLVAALARNMPPGITVRLHSQSAGAGFDSGTIAIERARQEVLAMVELPAGFWGTLAVTLANPGGATIPAEACIDIRCYRQTEPAASPFALQAGAHGIRMPLAAAGEVPHLALVGSYSFVGHL